MKTLLFVDYSYPPIGGVGSQRPLRFARYFPEFGWRTVVLTVGVNTVTQISRPVEDGEIDGVDLIRAWNPNLLLMAKKSMGYTMSELALGQQRPAGTQGLKSWLRRRAILVARNWMRVPDYQIGWYPFALFKGFRAAREHKPDIILSTSPPQTTHLVAKSLKERLGIPWVADMRDLWTRYVHYDLHGIPARLDRILERRTLFAADAIVTVSEPEADMFRADYPALGNIIRTITNGFDPREFETADQVASNRFDLVYTGSLNYPSQDPSVLFEAMAQLERDGIDLDDLQVSFYSKNHRLIAELASRFNLGGNVQAFDVVSPSDAVSLQKGADALLVVQRQVAEKGIYSMKLLEYLGARRPILVVAPFNDSSLTELVPSGKAVSFVSSVEEIKTLLSGWLREFRATGRVDCPDAAGERRRFDFRELTASLVDLFETVLEERRQ